MRTVPAVAVAAAGIAGNSASCQQEHSNARLVNCVLAVHGGHLHFRPPEVVPGVGILTEGVKLWQSHQR